MGTEKRRGCGFRKPNGLYLTSKGRGVTCDRLPTPVVPCRCCGYLPKQLRSHQWLPGNYFGEHRMIQGGLNTQTEPGVYDPNAVPRRCPDLLRKTFDPLCHEDGSKRLLMWVGNLHYTPDQFVLEAEEQGISKRVSEVPVGLVLGETWVLLAHPEAVYDPTTWAMNWLFGDGEVLRAPGIFHGFVPDRIELILKEAVATPERIELERKRGVDVVIIPNHASDARVSWRPGEERPKEADPPPEVDPVHTDKSNSPPETAEEPGSNGRVPNIGMPLVSASNGEETIPEVPP